MHKLARGSSFGCLMTQAETLASTVCPHVLQSNHKSASGANDSTMTGNAAFHAQQPLTSVEQLDLDEEELKGGAGGLLHTVSNAAEYMSQELSVPVCSCQLQCHNVSLASAGCPFLFSVQSGCCCDV